MALTRTSILMGASALVLAAIGLGYQNCGSQMGTQNDNPASTTSSTQQLNGRLPAGVYTVEFKDGSKAEIRKPELVKYTVEFKDGSIVELAANPRSQQGIQGSTRK